MTRLAIVIVSFNTRRDLEACLRSLHASPPGLTHAIVVVDNASSDGSVEAVRTAWPHVQVIEMGRNAGFAAATNAGIRACESDLVLLLNSDTIVPPGSIDRLAGALDDDPAAAAAGPRLVGLDGTVELSFGRMLSPWNEARQRLITLGLARRLGPVVRWFERQVSTPHHPEWVSGACLLVRRGGRGRGRMAGRTVLPVRGGRRPLRGAARRGAPRALHARLRDHSRTGPIRRLRSVRRARGLPAQPDRVLPQAPPVLDRRSAPLPARARPPPAGAIVWEPCESQSTYAS